MPGWVAAGFELDTRQSIPECRVLSINAKQLKSILGNVRILDIRNQLEVLTMGRFPNALHIPFEDLEARSEEIPSEHSLRTL